MSKTPIIAIIGRPNVGKSTLFNRLIGKRHAVISEKAGTTRDRIYKTFICGKYETKLVDTGGIQKSNMQNMEADIQSQAKTAIEEADIIIFLVDITNEMTGDDFKAADILRKSCKNITLVANKCDNKNLETNAYNIYELGFGEAMTISAIHNTGIEELKSKITKTLKQLKFKSTEKKSAQFIPQICIIGKPNAGKSSLINAFSESKKIIVSNIPGTTRDSTDTEITYNNKKFNLMDTAGLKKPGKTKKGIEKWSMLRGFSAIEKADVVVVLIDGILSVSHQDCQVVRHALEDEKGLIIAVNKIDNFENEDERKGRLISILKRKMPFIPWAPLIFISAKNKTNIYEILNISEKIMEERKRRIKTSELNTFLQKITQKHTPASTKIKKPKFMYASQIDINPPKFLLFFKYVENMHFSYPRYLENEIRKEFGFDGTAIKLTFKQSVSKNPYVQAES